MLTEKTFKPLHWENWKKSMLPYLDLNNTELVKLLCKQKMLTSRPIQSP